VGLPTTPRNIAGYPRWLPWVAEGSQCVKQLPDRKVLFSTFWIFAVLNYIYADAFTLYFSPGLQKGFAEQLATGNFGGMQMTQVSALMFAILMETAMAMVLLSRVLDYTLNRWANIIIGVIHTLAVAWSLSGTPNLFYAFFATIEIGSTLFIVWYAWRWAKPEPRAYPSTDGAVQVDSARRTAQGTRTA